MGFLGPESCVSVAGVYEVLDRSTAADFGMSIDSM